VVISASIIGDFVHGFTTIYHPSRGAKIQIIGDPIGQPITGWWWLEPWNF